MTSETAEPSGVELIEALRLWWETEDLRQRELTERTGLAQATVSRILAGRTTRLGGKSCRLLAEAIPARYLDAVRQEQDSRALPAVDPTAPLHVFISSTYVENVGRRRKIRRAVERALMVPVTMEAMTADERPTKHACLDAVRKADVYVGLLGWRYGWIPPGEELSITELEYDAAAVAGKPRLLFVTSQPVSEIEREFDDGPDRFLKQHKLELFKRRVSEEVMPRPFTDADLELQVYQALIEHRDRRRAEGSPVRSTGRAPESAPEVEDEFAATLSEYYEQLEYDHSRLRLVGFRKGIRVPMRFEELYVDLDVRWEPAELGDARKRHEEDPFERGEGGTLSLIKALPRLADDLRVIVLLGHPGSGKTTQLRRVVLALARGEEALAALADFVPVFLPLRFLREDDDSLEKFFERTLVDAGYRRAFAKELWRKRKLLLCLDGIDEVPQARRDEVRGWIERLRRHHRILASCRYAGYEERENDPALRLHLKALDTEQVEAFVRQWYDTVEAALAREDGASEEQLRRVREKARARADDLLASIAREAHDNRIFALTHNPLLLTAICLVHRERNTLPRDLPRFLEATADVLLEMWRDSKQMKRTYEARSARLVLQRVALWLHEHERASAQAEESGFAEEVAAALREVSWSDVTAASFLENVQNESGLLVGKGDGEYGFLHLRFQEYFAALELRRRLVSRASDADAFRGEIQKVAGYARKSWWREPLRLLVAEDDFGLLTPLLAELLQWEDFEPHAARVNELVRDARSLDPKPFVSLLASAEPRDDARWPQRYWAAQVLRDRAPDSLRDVDTAPFEKIARSRAAGGAMSEAARSILPLLDPELSRRVAEAMQPRGVFALSGKEEGERVLAPRGGYELVRIPGGKFLMGSPKEEEGRWSAEGEQHEVVVPDFLVGVAPVTNEEYARFLEANPQVPPPEYWADEAYNQARQPVVGVSWEEARKYCEWAGLRLPTEAEWEYACRAGTTTRFWSGDDDPMLAEVGWYDDNSEQRLHPVGEKPANPFGLVDVHGNVWEWCQDAWSGNYEESQRAHPAAYEVKETSPSRVVRGGSWWHNARFARSAYRLRRHASIRYTNLGFRSARAHP